MSQGVVNGKVALITGGGGGIGEAVARTFAAEGAAVIITGRRTEVLETAAAGIRQSGGRVLVVTGAVTDEAHAQSAVTQAVQEFGQLDILVNNAGTLAFGKPIHETDDETWHTVLDVNLTGVFRMTRAAVPAMLKAGGGAIVNISSIAGQVGIPLFPAYSATKGGVDALTRSIAVDYAKQGIRCNTVSPGLIDTPMASSLIQDKEMLAQVMAAYPIDRPGTPDEVARLVLFLASDQARWITGGNFPIDGGMTAK